MGRQDGSIVALAVRDMSKLSHSSKNTTWGYPFASKCSRAHVNSRRMFASEPPIHFSMSDGPAT